MCVREGEVLSIVPKAAQKCSAVRDLGSWAEVLYRVPWTHIKYVNSSSHRAVEKLCNLRNSSWVVAHHTPRNRDVQRAGQLPAASTPVGKAGPRMAQHIKSVQGGLETCWAFAL